MTVYDWFSLFGGIALFLYGMNIMSTGLRNAAGDKMRDILEHVTSNKFMAVLMGLVVTFLIQSSSATDMMVIGFVNAGLMSLSQAIGVILGANIGTTITAQITAFNLTAIAPIILFLGCIMWMFIKKNIVKNIGCVIMGFGMLFVGIGIVKEAIIPLSESKGFIAMISTLSNPALAVIFGVLFTALLQSSSSSTVIFQMFAVQGLLSYHTAVYLVIGAAIGSVAPNLLASLTTNRDGKRCAILNLLFNLFRAAFLLILIGLVPQILDWICALSPNNIARQIANTHTIFSIIAVLVALPFTKYIVWLAGKLIPDDESEKEDKIYEEKLRMLDKNFMSDPPIALDTARQVISVMAELAQHNLQAVKDQFESYDEARNGRIHQRENTLDHMTDAVNRYLLELSPSITGKTDSLRQSFQLKAMTAFERIGDLDVNIELALASLNEKKETLSPDARQQLERALNAVQDILDRSIEAFNEHSLEKARKIEPMEEVIDVLIDQIKDHHIERLASGQCTTFAGIQYENILTHLERISDQCSDLGVFMISRYDKAIRGQEHEYLHELHHTDDPAYWDIYDEAFDKYFEGLAIPETDNA